MAKTRKILHLDLDAFFCAVEGQLNPALRGKPIVVGGLPNQRGVVASASYPARRYGVRSAMPMSQALRLCPELIVVSQPLGDYEGRSEQVMEILRDTAPDVEPLSIDEAFLDVTILPGTIEAIARRLQSRVNAELGLPCSLGGATSKLVAKTANTVGKARQAKDVPPNTITIVAAGEERQFMAGLPIRSLWGIGPKTAESLEKLGLTTIGEIAGCSEDALAARLGKPGRDIWYRANAIDHRPLLPQSEVKSISKSVTFMRDISDEAELKLTLRRLSDGVGRQARQAGLTAATVKIKLRWSDYTTLTRQLTLANSTDLDNVICDCAWVLFDRYWVKGKPVRLMGVGLSRFIKPTRQIDLWEDRPSKKNVKELQSTLDRLRDRYGDKMIGRASDLNFHHTRTISVHISQRSMFRPK